MVDYIQSMGSQSWTRLCAHAHIETTHGFQLRSRRREVVGYCGTQKPADMCPELS